jgi:hypothetical protein
MYFSICFRILSYFPKHFSLKGLTFCELNKASCQNIWEVLARVQIREVALDPVKDPGKTLKF